MPTRDRHAGRARLCAEIGEWERYDHPDQLSSSLGIVPPSTPPERNGGWGHHEGRLHPGQTAAGRGGLPLPPRTRGRRSARAPPARARTEISTSPGAPSADSTPAGASSKTPATSPAESSQSRSPASSPPTAGRSPPGALLPTPFRQHPCRPAAPPRTQPHSHRSSHAPTGGSPPRAEPDTQPPLRLARRPTSRLAHTDLRD